MRKLFPVAVSFVAVIAITAGCDTMRRAREAQRAIAPAAVDLGGFAVGEEDELEAATNAVSSRVNLVGFKLGDFVSFALTNRPDLVEAELAVEKARLAVTSVEAEEWPQLGL